MGNSIMMKSMENQSFLVVQASGIPPHTVIAFRFGRLGILLCRKDSIRSVFVL